MQSSYKREVKQLLSFFMKMPFFILDMLFWFFFVISVVMSGRIFIFSVMINEKQSRSHHKQPVAIAESMFHRLMYPYQCKEYGKRE